MGPGPEREDLERSRQQVVSEYYHKTADAKVDAIKARAAVGLVITFFVHRVHMINCTLHTLFVVLKSCIQSLNRMYVNI